MKDSLTHRKADRDAVVQARGVVPVRSAGRTTLLRCPACPRPHSLTRNQACMLCSLAGNLRVIQKTADGNKGVHMLP